MKDVHETEKYATIDDFPDYLVTSHGRVLSLKHDDIRELKPVNDKDGYYYVNLYKNGKMISKSIHRLVAQAFILNSEKNKNEVNHIDEDKSNNHASNLEWMTHKENSNYRTRNERISNTMKVITRSEETKQKMSQSRIGKYKGKQNPNAKSVIGFKINGCDIKYYKYITESEKDGFHQSGISSCCKGKLKSHKGYNWFYADEFFNRKG